MTIWKVGKQHSISVLLYTQMMATPAVFKQQGLDPKQQFKNFASELVSAKLVDLWDPALSSH